jgi:hypothetical protein
MTPIITPAATAPATMPVLPVFLFMRCTPSMTRLEVSVQVRAEHPFKLSQLVLPFNK